VEEDKVEEVGVEQNEPGSSEIDEVSSRSSGSEKNDENDDEASAKGSRDMFDNDDVKVAADS